MAKKSKLETRLRIKLVRSNSPTVLITVLPTKNSFGHRKMTLLPNGRQYGTLAKHQPIACWFNKFSPGRGGPCVALYPGTTSRTALHEIVHESIHHALQWLGDPLAPDGSEENYDSFDNLFGDYRAYRKAGF